MTLSLDTAYRSFGGEVEASSTPTICRLPDSRRHQLSAIALRRFYQADRHTAKKAAQCPEPLCPTSVLPPLGRCECHLLRGRYPSVIAPTGSCATPVGLSPASAFSLVRRVLADCTQSLLPPGASRRYL